MNKYQEALNKIKNMGDKDLYNERHLEWCNTLQELVDKETPKKPLVNKYKNSEHYLCPNCKGHRFGIVDYGEYKNEWRKSSELMTYCPKCGQKLDWRVEDDQNT